MAKGNQVNLGDSERVGGVHVDITANTTPLEQGLAQGEAQVKQSAGRMAAEGEKAGSFFERQAEGFKRGAGRQIEALTSIIGKVTAAVGVFTLMYNIGTRVAQMFESGAEKARRFSEAVDLRNARASFEQLDKQIMKLEADLAGVQASIGGTIEGLLQGETEASLIAQIEKLEKIRSSVQGQLNAQRLREQEAREKEAAQRTADEIARIREQEAREKEAAQRTADEIARIRDRASLDSLSGVARVEEAERQALLEIDALRKKIGADQFREQIDEAERLTRIKFVFERNAAQDAERLRRQAIEREAAAFREAFVGAFNDIRQAQVGAFGAQDIVVAIEQLTALVQRLEARQ